jgi:hypothetical protein
MTKVLLLVSFVSLVLGNADSDVAIDRDGGGHGHNGEHHSDHHGGHHAEHNEVHHNETEHHAVHNEVHDAGHHAHAPRAGGPIENAIYKLEQQFLFLLGTITGE